VLNILEDDSLAAAAAAMVLVLAFVAVNGSKADDCFRMEGCLFAVAEDDPPIEFSDGIFRGMGRADLVVLNRWDDSPAAAAVVLTNCLILKDGCVADDGCFSVAEGCLFADKDDPPIKVSDRVFRGMGRADLLVLNRWDDSPAAAADGGFRMEGCLFAPICFNEFSDGVFRGMGRAELLVLKRCDDSAPPAAVLVDCFDLALVAAQYDSKADGCFEMEDLLFAAKDGFEGFLPFLSLLALLLPTLAVAAAAVAATFFATRFSPFFADAVFAIAAAGPYLAIAVGSTFVAFFRAIKSPGPYLAMAFGSTFVAFFPAKKSLEQFMVR